MRTHDKLPQAIKNNGTQIKIREWCRSNKLADHLVLIRTGKPVGAAVSKAWPMKKWLRIKILCQFEKIEEREEIEYSA